MSYYNKKNTEIQFITPNFLDFFDYNLPTPHAVQYPQGISNNYRISFVLNGIFVTKKAQTYLNDIIARFYITFGWQMVEVLQKMNIEKFEARKLQEFQNLKSLQKEYKHFKHKNNLNDNVFWAIKYFVEAQIKQQGEGNPVFYENVENWAFRMFFTTKKEVKDKSTLRAKCRSVWNYYNARDWQLTQKKYIKKLTKEEYSMTKSEIYKKINKQREAKSKAAIENAITGKNARAMFTKKNGKWNAVSISKYLKMDVRTVRKHLKNL